MFHPAGLEPGVGDAQASGSGKAVEGVFRPKSFAAEEAGDKQTGATNSSEAMGADRVAGTEAGVKAVDKTVEFRQGVGDRVVGDGEGEMFDTGLATKLGLGLKVQNSGFFRLQKRNEGPDALLTERQQGGAEQIAARGARDNGDARWGEIGGEGKAGGIHPIWLDGIGREGARLDFRSVTHGRNSLGEIVGAPARFGRVYFYFAFRALMKNGIGIMIIGNRCFLQDICDIPTLGRGVCRRGERAAIHRSMRGILLDGGTY
jgi:hypothetical protein